MYMYAYEKTIGIEGDSIMFNNGRKNICVILCDVAGHYHEIALDDIRNIEVSEKRKKNL